MRALGRNPAYRVVLILRMTRSKGRYGIEGPEDISEVTIDGGASTEVKAGRSVDDLNGDMGVVIEEGNWNGDMGEDDGVVLCEEIKMELFELWEFPLGCLIFALGVSGLDWGIAGVSFCSARFGKARWVILVWPSSQVNSSVVSAGDMVVQRNVRFFSPNAL
jgi:hypothetical protein